MIRTLSYLTVRFPRVREMPFDCIKVSVRRPMSSIRCSFEVCKAAYPIIALKFRLNS